MAIAPRRSGGLRAFVSRVALERNLYGALAFAETAESLRLCRAALDPTPGDRIAGITSSGDVLLSMLARGASEVIGFDHNPMQTALAELKRAAICRLDVSRYRGFFGVDETSIEGRLAIFSALAPELPEDARRLLGAGPRAIAAGLLNRGMTYLIIRALSAALKRLVEPESMALFLGDSGDDRLREQELRALLGTPVARAMLLPLLRKLSPQLKWLFFPHSICRVSRRPDDMIADFFGTFAPLFVQGARHNPVLCRAATGAVHPEWCQELYAPAHFVRIASARQRIRFETAAITDGLSRLPSGWATKVYLSNAPDYLSESELDRLAAEVRRVARPDARVLYFSLCDLDRLSAHLGAEVEDIAEIRRMDEVHLYPAIVVRRAGGTG